MLQETCDNCMIVSSASNKAVDDLGIWCEYIANGSVGLILRDHRQVRIRTRNEQSEEIFPSSRALL